MQDYVPWIGAATRYGVRTKGSKRVKRTLTWKDLMTKFTPYPTIIIPTMGNTEIRHAFCVVDDLIFDSTTLYTMKLTMESVNWITRGAGVAIEEAYRFATKYSPKGVQVEGEYKRKMKTNWEHSSMPFNEDIVPTETVQE